MRRAIAFLSIIIFTLSLVPCTDCYGEESAVEQEVATQNQSEDAHADDVEDCSPFCCACCSFTISQKPFEVDLAYQLNSSYDASIFLSEPTEHAGKIWQPPRA